MSRERENARERVKGERARREEMGGTLVCVRACVVVLLPSLHGREEGENWMAPRRRNENSWVVGGGEGGWTGKQSMAGLVTPTSTHTHTHRRVRSAEAPLQKPQREGERGTRGSELREEERRRKELCCNKKSQVQETGAMQDEEEEGARIHTQTNEESRAHTHKNTRPRGKGGMGYGQRKRGGGGESSSFPFQRIGRGREARARDYILFIWSSTWMI